MTAQDRPSEKPPVGPAAVGQGAVDNEGDNHGTGDSEPLLPDRAAEDTDAAWGEFPQRDDDRLCRDRPPHWDDF